MDFKPYVALDIETTGIADSAQVLQIGIIVDDLVSPIASLYKTSFLVDNSNRIYTGVLEPTGLAMNAWIFAAMADKPTKTKAPYPIYEYSRACVEFSNILKTVSEKTGRSIIFAGKNVATFDIPKLRANGFLEPELIEQQGIEISYRTIDIGSLYFPDFGYVPTANEINEKIGRKPASHDALGDALDVVCAIRTKLKIAV